MNGRAKHALLARVADCLGLDFEAFERSRLFTLLRPEELRALPHHLVDVQLHTHRHRTPREHSTFHRELTDNRHWINDAMGGSKLRNHFCYPSGDYAAPFLPWLKEEGIVSATTCVPGLTSRRNHRLLLPRFVDTMLTTDAAFRAWIHGFAELLPGRREYRLDRARA